ncbi:hypothetical protein LRP52_19100 [Photobacterium sp. ZSDE20]|nr:hypothetical protein [Photobacterium sp. ZSDE20]
MKKLSLLALVALTGCANTQTNTNPPITKEAAQMANRVKYINTQCYTNGYYSSEEMGKISWAVTYSLATWDLSKFDFDALQKETNDFYSGYTFDSGFCKAAGVDLVSYYHKAMNHSNQVKQMMSQRQPTTSSSSYPSSVNCKQLGAFLNAEIKTFSGGVCPIGWVKA